MHNPHPSGRPLLAGFGLALLAALAFVNGCVSDEGDGVSGPSAEPPPAEAADAMHGSAPVGIYKCHRNLQPRSLVVTPGPRGNNTCSVSATELPGSSADYCTPDGCLPCSYLQNLWECPSA
ncbi:hypothetical protein [Polyangium sp. y55x31]|uniref:hypothetical protein n=1 Tax=Polyangium sp. y55x31 TaxID=3042688 RepID=UPI0024826E6D|nr:hypothetical protein [Polyangium sp. y55x31]MDI1481355.1 hypothetical protein [Polyangium sp. y55x31]